MSHFRNANILITGGCGFIGSNLARRLVAEEAHVTLVDSLIPEYGGNLANIDDFKDKVHLNISDVRDPHSIAYLIRGKDYLFNLAGQTSHLDSMVDPFTDLDINASAQLAILEAARKHSPKIRVVFASTRQIYGRPQYLPVDEKHPISPVDVNGINKMAGEWYHLLYHQVYGIPCSALRLTNTYGPGMRVRDARQTFLGVWLKCILCGHPIKVFGDGLQLRDFNFIDDTVEAFILTAKSPQAIGRVMNLGSPEIINLKELAKKLVEIAGEGTWETVPFPPERKAIDIGDYYSDFGLIRDLLNWQPRVDLSMGLEKTLAFYRSFGKFYWE